MERDFDLIKAFNALVNKITQRTTQEDRKRIVPVVKAFTYALDGITPIKRASKERDPIEVYQEKTS